MNKNNPLYRLHNLPPNKKKADALMFIRSAAADHPAHGLPGSLATKLVKNADGFLRTATKSHLCHLYGYTEAEALAVIDEYIIAG